MSLTQTIFFIISLLLHNILMIQAQHTDYTIIIDVAGSFTYPGREIQHSYERGICFQVAQALKQKLEENKAYSVLIAQSPGMQYEANHAIIFTNRIKPDIYIKLGFYYQESLPLESAFFYYTQDCLDEKHIYNPLFFYPYNAAYLIHTQRTKIIVQKCAQIWTDKAINSIWNLQGVFAVPCNTLAQIQAPALYFECGLNTINDWKYLINPMITMIQSCLL